MSLKAKYLCILDIVLRVPPLFLFDKILKTEVFPQVNIHSILNYTHNEHYTQDSFYKALPIATFKLLMCCAGNSVFFLRKLFIDKFIYRCCNCFFVICFVDQLPHSCLFLRSTYGFNLFIILEKCILFGRS